MLYLICYDIVTSRNRRKVANVLLDHGARVQKSAFECDLASDSRLARMIAQLTNLIDAKTDTIRAYRICGSCTRERRLLGYDAAPAVLPRTVIV